MQNAFTGGDLTKTLRRLNLNSNRISSLNRKSFSGLASVEEIALENNEISEIEVKTFSALSRLRVVLLKGNGTIVSTWHSFLVWGSVC